MFRTILAATLVLTAAPALANDKAQSCEYQAQVVAAIQAARVDRVAERKVQEHILASDPSWPEQYNNAIPLIAPWVYEQKRSVIRNEDLGAAWNELCLQQ